MKIKPIIFCWHNQYDNVIKTEKALREIFPETLSVVNTNSPQHQDHWVKLRDDYYFHFIKQFMYGAHEACDGYDAMLMVQGDITYDKWDAFVNDALEDHKKYNWGVYAAYQTYAYWHPENSDIKRFRDDDTLALVTCTDTNAWIIKSEILSDLIKLDLDWSSNPVGWGTDWIISILSYISGKPVIRNYKHKVDHAEPTDYIHSKARSDGALFIEKCCEKYPWLTKPTDAIQLFKTEKVLPSFNNFNYNLY